MIIKTFLFHRVSDEKDLLWPPMSTNLFNSIIADITRKHHVINFEDYVLNMAGTRIEKPLATVLFDDGYKDNIEYAAPILVKHRCPASFYVVTDCIDKGIPTWTYIVDFLFQNTAVKSLELNMSYVPAAFSRGEFSTLAQRVQFGGRLKPWMKTLSNTNRQAVITQITRTFSDVTLPENKMMSWNDLRQLKALGFTIGSHSVTHPLLATIDDDAELIFELKKSGERIEAELGEFPITISYPIGSYDERVTRYSQQVGYKLGLAVHQRFFNSSKDDLFAIPRVELYNEPFWKCKLRMNGLYSWVKRRMPG